MSMKNLEDLMNQYMNSSSDPKIAQTANALKKSLSPQEGQQIAEELTKNFGSNVERAINAAQSGNMNVAKAELNKILSTKEGAKLAQRIMSALGK